MHLKQDIELQNGKYRIVRVLGQGGFGITYLAEHTMLDKYVAIKEFFPKEYCDREDTTSHVTLGSKNTAELVSTLKSKFIKEAKNISKLRHPNIITIHDIFEENSTAYYVMEFIDGQSLSEIIITKGAIDETSAVRCIVKISDAVGYMHSLSMNHLDLKPANIMIRSIDGEPVLIDFGLSKQYDASGGQTSTTPVGISHGYAPIEQYRPGGVATFTPQTDIYALGATLYALLSGNTPPHYSDILEDGLPELPSSVSSSTKEAIEHAMEIKKNKRPESIARFLEELNAYVKNSLSEDIKDETLIDDKEKLIDEEKTNETRIIIEGETDANFKEVNNNTNYLNRENTELNITDSNDLPENERNIEKGHWYFSNGEEKIAAEFYLMAAEEGDPMGMACIGQMYLNGVGINQDVKKAILWLEKSAEAGEVLAMRILGDVYSRGVVVEQDYWTSLYWHEKATRIENAQKDECQDFGIDYNPFPSI